MFKNAILYKISGPTENLEASLQRLPFQACGPSDQTSIGWVPPRAAHGALVESVEGQLIVRLCTEKKTVPAEVLQRALDERLDHIEQRDGYRPGRKLQRQIKEEILLELLPNAFPKRSHVTAWIWVAKGLLVVDASSPSAADELALQLGVAGMIVVSATTKVFPAAYMAASLAEGAPDNGHFPLGSELELAAEDESKSKVRYANLHLDREDIRDHMHEGKMPTKLGLVFADRVSFVLTESGALKKIKFLERVTLDHLDDDETDEFDASVFISTGELAELLTELTDEMGGIL